jgi:pantoate--beta-alanine ligase
MKPTDPRIICSTARLQAWADEQRAAGRRIALVPTMGALHEGHLSLVRLARYRADRVVVSIFVNPTQFGPNEDFKCYPRDLASDIAKLRPLHTDIVFAPPVEQIYPPGDCTWVEVEGLSDAMCGRGRPGHFKGVTTVVARLLLAAKPHIAVFGEKDYQQLVTIRHMVRDLGFDVDISGGPTVREPDGVAMSSRNAYLSFDGRQQARSLNAGLYEAQELFRSGERDPERLVAVCRQRIDKEPLAEIEYIEVRDADSLVEIEDRIERRAVVGVAVRFENTRLIDNAILELR